MTYIFFLKSANFYGLNQPLILIRTSHLNLLKRLFCSVGMKSLSRRLAFTDKD